MDARKTNTPEDLHQAIVEFLQSDYSSEDLVYFYNDACKCAASFRGIYSAIPTLPVYKSNPLDGLQDIMDWSEKASKVIDDIVTDLEQQTISKATIQLKKLRGIADSVLSLVDIKLKEQAQKKARAKVEEEYKKLDEEASKTKGMLLTQQLEIVGKLEREAQEILMRETKDAVQIYLSKDTTFKNRISQQENEINKLFENLNKLIGSDTPTGKLLDIYCKLKNIPLQRQFDDVSYAYSPIDDWADIICDGCSRLYRSIDKVIKTFEEIQAKVAQKTTESRQQQKKDHNVKTGGTCKTRDNIQKTVTVPNKTMDNLEQQIEVRLNELSDDELNKLAIHLKVQRANEGIQAPLGVKISDLQKINFIKWIKKTGNIEKAGIYLGTIGKSELPREELSKQQRTIEKAKSQTRTDRVINLVKDHRLLSIIILLCVLIIAVGTVVEKFDSIITFWHKITGQRHGVTIEDNLTNSIENDKMSTEDGLASSIKTDKALTENELANSVQIVTVSTRPELITRGRLAIIGLIPEQEQILMSSYSRTFIGMIITFVERNRLNEILSEQDLLNGRINEKTRPKIKQILAAEALVMCTYYEDDVDKVERKLRIRIVDSETGAICGSVVTQGPDNFKQHCEAAVKALKVDLMGSE